MDTQYILRFFKIYFTVIQFTTSPKIQECTFTFPEIHTRIQNHIPATNKCLLRQYKAEKTPNEILVHCQKSYNQYTHKKHTEASFK
jgi:hypothetical protein